MAQKERIKEDYISADIYRLLTLTDFPFRWLGITTYKEVTQSIVVKWLRIKHNIHIFIDYTTVHKYEFHIVNLPSQDEPYYGFDYNSPEEGIEIAILYTLQNLIK